MRTVDLIHMYGVTRQMIFILIKNNRLRGVKTSNRWDIDPESAKEYFNSRYDRKHSTFNGEKIFDLEKGNISVAQAAKIRRFTKGHIYHAIRTKRLNFKRIGCNYVLNLDDVKNYKPNRKPKCFRKLQSSLRMKKSP